MSILALQAILAITRLSQSLQNKKIGKAISLMVWYALGGDSLISYVKIWMHYYLSDFSE